MDRPALTRFSHSLCVRSVSPCRCSSFFFCSGKSSLFRVIGELWPLHCGVLQKPAKEDILFIPQKPYLVLGTLRDQIIYPHERADMERLGVTDEDLGRLLQIVDPAKNITTEWQWSVTRTNSDSDWRADYTRAVARVRSMAALSCDAAGPF